MWTLTMDTPGVPGLGQCGKCPVPQEEGEKQQTSGPWASPATPCYALGPWEGSLRIVTRPLPCTPLDQSLTHGTSWHQP